ncbi:uncharacterized protein LOC106055368 isoform X2 [Biomphalaria glabrata]|uniref:Uncharacterized protein LOC106055368 isoform X2 n=1 Tax=Biomphalaria glabrata TaxID=6526 RepID=A0A9W3BCX7_BIOGL|nr:uncharacterized protein LOC106055368 isoform X2 [Biomphalaria glabrata]
MAKLDQDQRILLLVFTSLCIDTGHNLLEVLSPGTEPAFALNAKGTTLCSEDNMNEPYCDFQCLCENGNCTASQDCKCKTNHFGYYCQYEDYYGDKDNMDVLRDDDLDTCLGNNVTTVQLTFEPIYISFVTILYNGTSTKDHVKIHVNLGGQTGPIDKLKFRHYGFSRNRVEFHWFNIHKAEKLIFTGSDVNKICEVYISQDPNECSPSADENAIKSTHDGKEESSRFDLQCNKTLNFYLTFNRPVTLTHFKIIGKANEITIVEIVNMEDVIIQTLNIRERLSQQLIKSFTNVSEATQDFKISALGNITIDEIYAYGDCPNGMYSFQCNEYCPEDCLFRRCTIDGTCLSCNGGFYGPHCEGFCDRCRCHQQTGECLESDGEVDKEDYSVLPYPFKCPGHCTNDFCDSNGTCIIGCTTTDYSGRRCTLNKKLRYCSPICLKDDADCECNSCVDGMYGPNCSLECPELCGGNHSCQQETGECNSCVQGRFMYDCSEECSPTCEDRTCNIYYGECTYGCLPGHYGLHCDQPCLGNCSEYEICNRSSGECLDYCPNGFFGIHCEQKCSPNCAGNGTCLKLTGECEEGCKARFTALNCSSRCSPNCAGNGSCHSLTRHCDEGCKPYFFTQSCAKRCSPFCFNNTQCDTLTGVCRAGCKEGFFGPNCFKTGLLDTRGTWTCHCNDGKYNRSNPVCDWNMCIVGWFGERCNFIDLAASSRIPIVNLMDNNDSTCYTTNGEDVVAKWATGKTISWVRLIFDEKDIFDVLNDTFEIHYTNSTFRFKCVQPHVLQVHYNLDTLDLKCESVFNITELYVRWKRPRSLCSIRIFGGRNFATLGSLYLAKTHSKDKVQDVPNLVDGNFNGVNCTTLGTKENHTLVWHLGFKIIIHQMNFYTVPYLHTAVVEIEFHNFKKTMTLHQNMTLIRELLLNEVYVDNEVAFSFFNVRVVSGQVRLCELELFGHCEDGFYGALCDGICSIDCVYRLCDEEGRCFRCYEGKTGHFCKYLLYESVLDNGTDLDLPKNSSRSSGYMENDKNYLVAVYVVLATFCLCLCCKYIGWVFRSDSVGMISRHE